jgi:hypothetical protein
LRWRFYAQGMSTKKELDRRVQKCLDQAAECERRAARAQDELAKRTFADAAKGWCEQAAAFSQLKR